MTCLLDGFCAFRRGRNCSDGTKNFLHVEHKDQPLEESMVVSVETTLMHPSRGFIKLEDTVVTTANGHEVYADGGRGWNRGGTAAHH